MSQIIRKWIANSAVNNEKVDEADIYTITGLLVDSTSGAGRVGIGVTDPLDALHIRRPDTSAGLMLDLNDGSNGRTYQIYSAPPTLPGTTGVLNIKDHDTGIDRFTLKSTASLGNIGISTSDPLDTIHARATTGSSTLRLDLDDGVAGQAYQLVSNPSGDFAIIDVDATATRLTIDSTGTTTIPGDTTVGGNFEVNGTVTVINTEIVITDQLQIDQLDATQAALIASQDNASATETVVKFENASALNHAFTVDRGNVGFGTTDPQAALHVEGDIVGKLTASASNIGSTTRRIGTIYMASDIDYASNLHFNSSGTKITFDTTWGRVGIGSTLPASSLDVVGVVVGSLGITATTGPIVASSGDMTASAGLRGNYITGNTGIIATTGNISATAGAVSANTTMTAGGLIRSTGGGLQAFSTVVAGTGITATTGPISATAGAVSANTTMTAGGLIRSTGGGLQAFSTVVAGTGITATTGPIVASSGDMTASAGLRGNYITGNTGIIATTGNISAAAGAVSANTTMTAGGSISSTGGAVSANTTMTAGGLISSTGGGLQAFSTLQVGTTSYLIGNVGVGTTAGTDGTAIRTYRASDLNEIELRMAGTSAGTPDRNKITFIHGASTEYGSIWTKYNGINQEFNVWGAASTPLILGSYGASQVSLTSSLMTVGTPGTVNLYVNGKVGIGTTPHASATLLVAQSIAFPKGSPHQMYVDNETSTGNGQAFTLSAGNGFDNSDGGDLFLRPGRGTGTGVDGDLIIGSTAMDALSVNLVSDSATEVKIQFIKDTTVAAVFTTDPTSCKIGSWDEAQDTKILRGGQVKITTKTDGAEITGKLLVSNFMESTSYIKSGSTLAATSLISGGNQEVGANTAGTLIAFASDKRMKENITPVDSALEKVMKMRGVYFDWKQSDPLVKSQELSEDRELGMIADEVKEVIPEVVGVGSTKEKYLSLRYSRLVPLLLEAIKELKAQVDVLQNKE